MKAHVRPADSADLSSIRQPQKPPRYGQGRSLGMIEFPAATRGHWYTEMKSRRDEKTQRTP